MIWKYSVREKESVLFFHRVQIEVELKQIGKERFVVDRIRKKKRAACWLQNENAAWLLAQQPRPGMTQDILALPLGLFTNLYTAFKLDVLFEEFNRVCLD